MKNLKLNIVEQSNQSLRKLVIGILLSLLVFTSANLAHAQTTGLSASTSKKSYEQGDRVTVTGSISQLTSENPVTVIVRNPIGNVYEVGQVPLVGTSFSHSFVLNNDARGGPYTVNVRQGGNTVQIQFQVIAGQTQIIPVFDSQIRVSGKDTNSIKYGNVEISPADNSLTIQVNASKIQNGTVTEEYHVPKHVIDTTSEHLAIKENGNSVECPQTDADVEWVLDCPINANVYEITIIGTSVIPEFGTTASTILALGIMIVMIVFTRNRLFVKPS